MINVLEYLEKSADNFHHKTAVRYENESISFSQLLTSSQKAGSLLVEKSTARKPVIVIMEKKIETLIAFFGVVHAGCFYISVNPQQPIDRINKIIAITGSKLIIHDDEFASQNLLNFEGEFINYQQLAEASLSYNSLAKRRAASCNIDPLYCNFTSGTTGVPKGVLVSHRSVIDFMDVFPELFHISADDVIGNQAPFDFDVSVKDIFSSLKTGATLVIIPKSKFSFVTQLIDYLDQNEVTTLIWAVSALCLLVQFKGFQYKRPGFIRKVLFSGEVMPLKYLKDWINQYPEAQFVNLYGPTEITCNCTYFSIENNSDYTESLPIGSAFPNHDVFLIDENKKLVNDANQIGEIYVSGTCLSLGYFNNPEQTAKHFVQNPLNTSYPQTVYRTGDSGYYDNKGLLHFSGRVDFQIKHMGFRIELEEIEATMHLIDDVERACCLYDDQRKRIVAYYTGSPDRLTVTNYLHSVLPVHMIPTDIRQLNDMPITANGKVDRKHLRQQYDEGVAEC